MKTNKIIFWTICIGLVIIILCIVSPFFGIGESWWDNFCYIGDVLGYIANLTIVAAVFKFLTKETLDIKGIGKIKVSRMQNNIQDLTNIINMKLYHGHNFKRGPLLDAFYQNSNFRFISIDPDHIKLSEAADTPEHH